MVIDTLLLCFCEDCQINDGTEGREYFMSPSLMVSNDPKIYFIPSAIDTCTCVYILLQILISTSHQEALPGTFYSGWGSCVPISSPWSLSRW